MDEAIAAAHARWPDVPACHGWLALDRRGTWRLKGDPVRHEGLIQFICRNYTVDETGNWLVHNGPQRVYVDLDYLPWVVRTDTRAGFIAHTGMALDEPLAAWLDDDGCIVLRFATGVALLDDRDLARFLDECRFDAETPTHWRALEIARLTRADAAERFAFNPRPRPSAP